MAGFLFQRLFGNDPRAQRKGKENSRLRRLRPLESLEERTLLAVTATFSATAGLLTVFGDNLDNTIAITRDAAGALLVNGGSVSVRGGVPNVANTRQINVFGLGGHDNVTLNEASGALPRAVLFGGTGNDTLTGGSAADQLFGQAGIDQLLGKGGADLLFGGADDDLLNGGDGDDQVFGESGNDRMIWNPGDDTDLNEGGTGVDTVEVQGGNGDEQFTVTANGQRVRFDRLSPAPFNIDIGTSENLVLNMNGGRDTFSATGNLAALMQLIVDGGSDNDTILGSNGADLLLGGDGNDFIDGQQGNDTAFLGSGNDVFQWDPGDGSDVIEGQSGTDTMLFNGSAGSEIFDVSANGDRVRFSRNLGNIVMDLNDVEAIDLNALGGTDTITVNHLSGTDLVDFEVSLAGVLGGTTGDSQADTVIVMGAGGNDIIDVFGGGSSVAVVGLSALVTITNAEAANDSLVVNGLGGSDGITASAMPGGIIKLTMDGGDGNDSIVGSGGNDVILAGDGDDFVMGRRGNDLAILGAGDDFFQWEPGDDSDVVEGQAGADVLFFIASNASETINILANGARGHLTRDVSNVTMDLSGVESIDLRALGGADNITIGDLTGTDITLVGLDLRGATGGGDGHADTITVNATQGDDVFGAAGDAGGVSVLGLTATVNIFHQEQVNDRLTLNALAGADVVDATSLEADGIQLTINGGLGADVLLGSEGNDLINGGDGNDLAMMGLGDDVFVWNPGDDSDVLEGQAGTDTMIFNGSAANETIDISAAGERVRFFRDVANVTMDTDDVEVIVFNALGGADTITINDVAGTDLSEIHLNLAGVSGSGDAQPDVVIVRGTSGDDVAQVMGDSSGVVVVGLPAQLTLSGTEAANDQLFVLTQAGDDVVDASGLSAGAIRLTADGSTGNDVLIGSDGDDSLFGGDGDDVLVGGPGIDFLAGGPGEDIEIQD